MWPPSSGRIGSRLIRPSERLTRASSSSDCVDADVDRLVGDVADPDDAGDLLALFGFEDAGEDRGGFVGDQPDRVAGAVAGGAGADVVRLRCRRRSRSAPARLPCRIRAGPRSSAPGRRARSSAPPASPPRSRRPACRRIRASRPASPKRSSRASRSRPAIASCRRRRRSGRPAAAPSPPGVPARIFADRLVGLLGAERSRRRRGSRRRGRCSPPGPAAIDDDPLPDRLPVVGAVLVLRRHLLLRVHAGDFHVAAERDRFRSRTRSRRV